MKNVKNSVIWVSRKLNALSGVIVLILMALTTLDVIARYFFNSPIRGTYDASGLMALVIISFALAQTQLEKGHISITILTEIMPRRINCAVQAFIAFICLCASGVVSWQSWVYGISLAKVGEASQTDKIPFAPFSFIISIGFMVLCLILLLNTIENAKEGLRK